MTASPAVLEQVRRAIARADREIAKHQAALAHSEGGDPLANPLLDLAAKYEAKWPEICYVKGGSRARKAVELVLDGRVLSLGRDPNGDDLWLVNGHRCSKAGQWCECEDRIRTDPTYGKLCVHRLAVALKTNWLGERHPQLLAWLGPLVDGRSEFTLLVERDYEWHGDGQQATVAGYQGDDHQVIRLAPAERMPVTLVQFQWVLDELGWSIADLPQKLPGWSDYLYPLRNGIGLTCVKEIFFHKGRTPQMEERERMRRLVLQDIAMHLSEVLRGPIQIDLPAWEARRVAEMVQKIETESITAQEVWAHLPIRLQLAILENDGSH